MIPENWKDDRNKIRIPSPFGNKIEEFELQGNESVDRALEFLRMWHNVLWFPSDPIELILNACVQVSGSYLMGVLMTAFPLVVGIPVILVIAIHLLIWEYGYEGDRGTQRMILIRSILSFIGASLGVWFS